MKPVPLALNRPDSVSLFSRSNSDRVRRRPDTEIHQSEERRAQKIVCASRQFNAEELKRLEAVEAKRGPRRGALLKSLLKYEANRLGSP
jgi:hypothetical protein